MKNHYDFVIIGAGPAGMAASAEAVKYGLSTIVLGEQQTPGGQVYRTIEQIGPDVMNILGPDYQEGKNLVRQFRDTSVDYLPGTTVWQVESGSDMTVSFVSQGDACQVRGKRILIAAYREVDVSGVGYFRTRPPIKPITVEQLSNLQLVE